MLPLSQTVAPKKSNKGIKLLILAAAVLCIMLAVGAWFAQQRKERVVIATRHVPFGQQIAKDDLATIEVAYDRAQQIQGITNPNIVIGQWARHEIVENAMILPAMLQATPPTQPVYPSGQMLNKNMVAVPFSTETVGPLTIRDLINIVYLDETGDPRRCNTYTIPASTGTTTNTSQTTSQGDELGQPYACRLVTGVRVLHVDAEQKVAYIEVPQETSLSVWAVQAAGLPMYAERIGATSDPMVPLQRLDVTQITPELVETTGFTSTTELSATHTLDDPKTAEVQP